MVTNFYVEKETNELSYTVLIIEMDFALVIVL